MTDCVAIIDCPLDSDVKEVERMVTVIESVIHVLDIKITGYPDSFGPEYRVEIEEIPLHIAEGRKRKI